MIYMLSVLDGHFKAIPYTLFSDTPECHWNDDSPGGQELNDLNDEF